MSTTVRAFRPRSSLITIFHYGREALLNRWKMILKCSFLLIFIPRFLAFFVFSSGAQSFADAVERGALSHGNLIDGITALSSANLERPLLLTFVALILTLIGALALAHMSWDYFEQNPSSFKNAFSRGSKTLLRKGFGAFVMLAVILVFSSPLTILRVVVLCLLVMLPMELAAGHQGGVKSVWNTIFLKYSARTALGRWPRFSNMMTLGGTALSIAFLLQLGLAYLGDIDVFVGIAAGRWHEPVHLWGGGTVSFAYLLQHILELLFDAALLGVTMPFIAALRYFSQKSTFTAPA